MTLANDIYITAYMERISEMKFLSLSIAILVLSHASREKRMNTMLSSAAKDNFNKSSIHSKLDKL